MIYCTSVNAKPDPYRKQNHKRYLIHKEEAETLSSQYVAECASNVTVRVGSVNLMNSRQSYLRKCIGFKICVTFLEIVPNIFFRPTFSNWCSMSAKCM
jgi:hypothetical protein